MKGQREGGTIMAIASAYRGLGYVAFEQAGVIFDWGRLEVREKARSVWLLKARELLQLLQPSVLVLEDVHHKSCKRSTRTRELIRALGGAAKGGRIAVVWVPRAEMLGMFKRMGAGNKDDIAAVVAKAVPELAPRLPPRRRIWEGEHFAMGIFEAAALALTHFNLATASNDGGGVGSAYTGAAEDYPATESVGEG